MSKHVGTDWNALRIEFVNGVMTFGQLAQTHGLKPATVRKQGERGNWMEQRRQLSHDVADAAQASLLHKRVEALEDVNEADLALAWHLRTVIMQRLVPDASPPLSAAELRSLAGAAVLAQKISHLAIGAVTAQHAHEHAGQGSSAVTAVTGTFVLTDAQRQAADEILDAYLHDK